MSIHKAQITLEFLLVFSLYLVFISALLVPVYSYTRSLEQLHIHFSRMKQISSTARLMDELYISNFHIYMLINGSYLMKEHLLYYPDSREVSETLYSSQYLKGEPV